MCVTSWWCVHQGFLVGWNFQFSLLWESLPQSPIRFEWFVGKQNFLHLFPFKLFPRSSTAQHSATPLSSLTHIHTTAPTRLIFMCADFGVPLGSTIRRQKTKTNWKLPPKQQQPKTTRTKQQPKKREGKRDRLLLCCWLWLLC